MNDTLERQIQKLEQYVADDPQSPLFARLAYCYLEAGRSRDALTTCDNGLAHHPFYTTGHLLKGKALLALNMKSEARREFEFVHEMLPFNEAVEHLLASIAETSGESFTTPTDQTPAETVETAPLTEEPAAEPPAASEPSAEQILSQFTEEQPSETPTVEGASAETEPQPFVEDQASGEPSPVTEEVFETAITEEPPSELPVSPGTEKQQPEPRETFDSFRERRRMELFGLENSISLEEYLSEGTALERPSVVEEPPPVESASSDSSPEPPPVETETLEDPFAALTQYEEQQSPPTTIPSTEAITEDPFSQLHAAAEETSAGPPEEPPAAPPETTEDPFAPLHQETEPPAQEPRVETTDEEPKDSIEELAEKLKDAKRITPVINLSDRTVTPPSEEDTPSGTGFVTPTLAEIYAKQGWFDDAIKAYKTLATTKPAEREKYEARIRELEEQKKQQEGG